jgi:hypothetical protein
MKNFSQIIIVLLNLVKLYYISNYIPLLNNIYNARFS